MKKEYNQHSSVKCYDNYSFYLPDFFLSCREKARDNKEFCRENSKPRHESQITNDPLSRTLIIRGINTI